MITGDTSCIFLSQKRWLIVLSTMTTFLIIVLPLGNLEAIVSIKSNLRVLNYTYLICLWGAIHSSISLLSMMGSAIVSFSQVWLLLTKSVSNIKWQALFVSQVTLSCPGHWSQTPTMHCVSKLQTKPHSATSFFWELSTVYNCLCGKNWTHSEVRNLKEFTRIS